MYFSVFVFGIAILLAVDQKQPTEYEMLILSCEDNLCLNSISVKK
jgi:hypothetical protein